MNRRTRSDVRSSGTKATGKKGMGQSDNNIPSIHNSINNYFFNINNNLNSSSINNNYTNILQISNSSSVDGVREVEVDSVGIDSNMPKADQLDYTKGEVDGKLGTKRKHVKELTISDKLYKRHCHRACSDLQTGAISAAYIGDLAADIAPSYPEGSCSHKGGDDWDLSGEKCSVPRPQGPILSENTPQLEHFPLVPADPAHREDGLPWYLL